MFSGVGIAFTHAVHCASVGKGELMGSVEKCVGGEPLSIGGGGGESGAALESVALESPTFESPKFESGALESADDGASFETRPSWPAPPSFPGGLPPASKPGVVPEVDEEEQPMVLSARVRGTHLSPRRRLHRSRCTQASRT